MPFLPKTSINKLTNDIQVRFIFTEKFIGVFNLFLFCYEFDCISDFYGVIIVYEVTDKKLQ